MPPVFTAVREIAEAVWAPEPGDAKTELWIENFETVGLSVERHSSVEQLPVVNEFQPL